MISFQLSAQGAPVILQHTPFDSWQSAQWTPQSLTLAAKRSKISPQVLSKRGSEHIFMYHAVDQPLSTITAISPHKSYKEIIYPSEKYFSILQEPFDGFYYYSSGGIELLEVDSVFTRESLKSLTFSGQLLSTEHGGLGQVNYWFGKENVTAYTHYDTSYNLHMVVYGQKRFIIFPPEAYRKLRLYPCLHQFYRQVHTNIFDSELSDVIKRLNGIDIVVNPGEVLYIPPYWFHSVVTMKTTISLNVWSQSEAYMRMEDIYAAAIPFEEGWGRVKLMQALNYLIKQLIRSVVPAGDVDSFMKESVYDRYEPLQAKLSATVGGEDQQSVKEFCLQTCVSDILESEDVILVNEGIANIVTLFFRIQPQPVLEINLANYIEYVTWRILGTDDVALLPFYFHSCF